MPRTFLFVVAVVALAVAPAVAQQRTSNTGNSAVNRVWPWSGVWGVLLLKHLDTPELQCQVYTGIRDEYTHEDYLWGWRDFKGELGFFVHDQAARPVSGPDITVYIDNVKVIAMTIAARSMLDMYNTIVAPVPDDKKQTVIELLKSGGTIKLVTETSNYAASLDGAKKAMENFDECRGQADRLNALQKSPG